MTILRQPLTILILACLAGCSNGPNSKFEEFGDRANTRGFGHKYAQPENATELVMGPGDSINIQIANNETLSGTQIILVEGTVTLPFIGQVKVAGLTPTQIRDKFEVLLSPYIREVTVQIVPVDIVSKAVYVVARDIDGAAQIRALPILGDMTLIDFFVQIGGVPVLGDDCHVRVIRGDPLHPQVLNINVRDMVVNGYTAGNIQMRPDDIVYIPPTFFAKLAMGVRDSTRPVRELSISAQGVLQAINLAEGRNRNGF